MKTKFILFILINVLSFSAVKALTVSAEQTLVCQGESNKITGTPNFLFASINWVIFNGSTCNPCSGTEIEVFSSFNGFVTVTGFEMFGSVVLDIQSVTYWVGPPSKPEITYVNSPDCIPEDHTTTFFVEVANGLEDSSEYSWSFPSCAGSAGTGSTDPNDPDRNCWYAYDASPTSDDQMLVHTGNTSGQVSVFVSNKCGTSSSYIDVDICGDDAGTGTGGNNGGGGTKPKPGGGTGPHIPFIGQNPGGITTHPNPFTAIINLAGDHSDNTNPNFTCTIFNGVGQVVYTEDFQEENNWRTSIETSDFESGIYFLEVVQDGKVLFVDKLIKQ